MSQALNLPNAYKSSAVSLLHPKLPNLQVREQKVSRACRNGICQRHGRMGMSEVIEQNYNRRAPTPPSIRDDMQRTLLSSGRSVTMTRTSSDCYLILWILAGQTAGLSEPLPGQRATLPITAKTSTSSSRTGHRDGLEKY